jgi:hypothetical protein
MPKTVRALATVALLAVLGGVNAGAAQAATTTPMVAASTQTVSISADTTQTPPAPPCMAC